jgi:hypothetical protein
MAIPNGLRRAGTSFALVAALAGGGCAMNPATG